MSAAAAKLLASSPTIEGITKLVNRFWCSEKYTVDPETLEIRHPEKIVPSAARIVKHRGRYRFEQVLPT